MADTQIYGTMCTDIGNAAIANSVLTGTKVNFAQIAVGDGDGTPYVPVSGMTALKHQVWSGPIAEVSQDPEQPNRMILHAVLPSSVGGWVMREIGVLDDKGRMIAIGNTPEIPKESMTSGTIMEMDLYIYISVVDARGVNVVIDPTVIIATKADINELWQAVTAHNTASDAHATLFAAKEGLLKDAASKTTPEDTDKVPMVDSADSEKTKLVLWSGIKSTLGSVFAALSHASTHATGGSDPIKPGDIGAAWTPSSVTVTLPTSGWALNSTSKCYEQTVDVANLLTSDSTKTVTIWPHGSTDAVAQLLTDAAYAKIFTQGGYVACKEYGKLYCRGPVGGEKPQVDFQVDVVFHR